MPKRRVFYSFDYEHDAMRVQQVRNMGVFDQNRPVSANDWEEVKRNGQTAIRKWIDVAMIPRSCVIVLVGQYTAERDWVLYEIKKAWQAGKGLFGIYIHHLKCPRKGTCDQGRNPFELFLSESKSLSELVPCHNPDPASAYQDIKGKLGDWVEGALADRRKRNILNIEEIPPEDIRGLKQPRSFFPVRP